MAGNKESKESMNKHDLRDELSYWKWLFHGQYHLRTAFHVFGSSLLGFLVGITLFIIFGI